MKKLRKYLGKQYIAISWTVIIGILLCIPGSMLPQEQTFAIPNFDKLVHVALFSGFVILWCMYFSSKNLPRKKLLRLFFLFFIISCTYGIGMEFVQKYFIPMRDYDPYDIILDLIGAGLGYGFCNITLID
ncbi:MAG TPA: VanZ family protein [Puia sp.]|nr:VanZ family protein [Puia sp.]